MARFLSRTLTASLALQPLAHGIPQGWKNANVVRQADEIPQEYDYIVVGAGTSGLTVADRLTEDGITTVLVIEHGDLSE